MIKKNVKDHRSRKNPKMREEWTKRKKEANALKRATERTEYASA